MEYRYLGNSGIKVSPLCIGSMQFGWTADEASSYQVLSSAYEAGINFIDTADVYSLGESETLLGNSLKGIRNEIVLATKVRLPMGGNFNRSGATRVNIMREVEGSLQRLQTDYIDLYQAHSMDSLTPMEETLGAFDILVRQGKVRYVGCSNFSAWQTMKAVAISERSGLARYISQQIQYSLLVRDAEYDLIPMGLDQGVGVMAWSPLMFGLLSGKIRRDAPQPTEGRLAALGVPSRPYFAPLHLQPLYRRMFGFGPGDFPVTERVAASTLALPFSSRLAGEDVRYIADALVEAVDAEAGS